MSTDPLLLVDTGADGVLLNLALAKLMGFHDSDLVTEECKGANGLMTVHTPKDLAGTEIEIGGKWYPLPSLKFGKSVPISLLGRDLMFAHFDLKMNRQRVRFETATVEAQDSTVTGLVVMQQR